MDLGHVWRFGLYDFLPPGTYDMTLALHIEDPGKRGYWYINHGFDAVSVFWSGEFESKPVRFLIKSNRHGTGDAINQGLADSFLMLGAWSLFEPKDSYPRAKAAAMRAIAIDEALASISTEDRARAFRCLAPPRLRRS
jgi:hypothetical protein